MTGDGRGGKRCGDVGAARVCQVDESGCLLVIAPEGDGLLSNIPLLWMRKNSASSRLAAQILDSLGRGAEGDGQEGEAGVPDCCGVDEEVVARRAEDRDDWRGLYWRQLRVDRCYTLRCLDEGGVELRCY